jgi:CRP-like cAMP-binding protein
MQMPNPLVVVLERRDRLSAEEVRILEGLKDRTVVVESGADIVAEGEIPDHSSLMLSGWSARVNMLTDGKRQISALHIPGDFIDLHSLLLRPMDHAVTALTDCRVAQVPHTVLREISETLPHLTRMLWMLTTIDAAIFRRGLVASGHLPAVGQIAHLFCDLFVRLSVVGLTKEGAFDLPLDQTDLADAMGLSTVHANRCLQILRRNGVLVWNGGGVTILDWEGLQKLAEFDPSYLNLEQFPR